MKTVIQFGLLLLAACLIAGVYGMLHNQISYTVSPDYFHQFKFIQFALPQSLQNRLGASWVGFLASWWMGLIIGGILIPVGFRCVPLARRITTLLKAFVLVALTALSTGLFALLYAYTLLDPKQFGTVSRYGQVITDPQAFLRAGLLHNMSYTGGVLGLGVGLLFLVYQRLKRPTDTNGKQSEQT